MFPLVTKAMFLKENEAAVCLAVDGFKPRSEKKIKTPTNP